METIYTGGEKENLWTHSVDVNKYFLPIRIWHTEITPVLPGTEVLFSYWKIRIRLDFFQREHNLFIPPEWRKVPHEILKEWVNFLRLRPFTNLRIGQVKYKWDVDVLLPEEQDIDKVPKPGAHGWPHLYEPIYKFNKPLPTTRFIPICVNRKALPKKLKLEKITHYWKVRIQEKKTLIQLWAPPEWRFLSPKKLRKWVTTAWGKYPSSTVFEGTPYVWHGETLAPVTQDPSRILYENKVEGKGSESSTRTLRFIRQATNQNSKKSNKYQQKILTNPISKQPAKDILTPISTEESSISHLKPREEPCCVEPVLSMGSPEPCHNKPHSLSETSGDNEILSTEEESLLGNLLTDSEYEEVQQQIHDVFEFMDVEMPPNQYSLRSRTGHGSSPNEERDKIA